MADFVPRLSTDSPTQMENNPWWYSNGNIFYASDYGLPNCTCYAYGRYAEILGSFKKLPTRNAGYWYGLAKDFNRGQTPALGAVACWHDPNGTYSGHVGIVEQIFSNGNFMCSYSGYGSPYFAVREIKKSESYTFVRGNGFKYTFQGFIYGYATPQDPEKPDEPLPETSWHCKATGYYSRTSQEAKDNATALFRQMSGYGWSLSAICGLLGNMEAECSYNPWLWEGNKILSSTDPKLDTSRVNGYGIVQWTPPGEYVNDSAVKARPEYAPNFSDKVGKTSDPIAQLWAIQNRTVPQGQWIQKSGFRVTWEEYKANQNSPEWSAECFVRDYERPAVDPQTGELYHLARRKEAARYWYNYFDGYDPQEPEPEPEEPDLPDPTPIPVPVPGNKKIECRWFAQYQGKFERTSEQALNNACCIFNTLFFDERWTVRAICGLLASVDIESGFNPYYWANDNQQPSFVIEVEGDGVKEYINTDLDDNSTGIRYGLLQWNPAGWFVHNHVTENWWNAHRTENYWEWKQETVAYANFLNPIYTVWFWYGWHYLITGYANTASIEDGQILDGDEQLKALLQIDYWDSTAPLTFDAYKRSKASVTWTAKTFAKYYCKVEPTNEHIKAAKFWYRLFKKYEDNALTAYGRRRQILD